VFPPVCALCHGNLERLHLRDSGLSCRAHSGIHDVSSLCAKAFLRLLSDSGAQELHCGLEKISAEGKRRGRKMKTGAMFKHMHERDEVHSGVLKGQGSLNPRNLQLYMQSLTGTFT